MRGMKSTFTGIRTDEKVRAVSCRIYKIISQVIVNDLSAQDYGHTSGGVIGGGDGSILSEMVRYNNTQYENTNSETMNRRITHILTVTWLDYYISATVIIRTFESYRMTQHSWNRVTWLSKGLQRPISEVLLFHAPLRCINLPQDINHKLEKKIIEFFFWQNSKHACVQAFA